MARKVETRKLLTFVSVTGDHFFKFIQFHSLSLSFSKISATHTFAAKLTARLRSIRKINIASIRNAVTLMSFICDYYCILSLSRDNFHRLLIASVCLIQFGGLYVQRNKNTEG